MIEVTSIKTKGHNCLNKILREAGKISNINKSKILPNYQDLQEACDINGIQNRSLHQNRCKPSIFLQSSKRSTQE